MIKKITRISLLMLVLFTSSMSMAQTITTFPYAEDFESFATCGTGCGAACPLTGGTNIWTNDLSDNLDWLVDLGGTTSTSTGPSIDHNPGTASGNYLYVETSCSGTGYPNMTANLISPAIDLTGTNNVQFEFWYHMFGTTMGMMHLDISTDAGATWTNDIIPAWTDDQDLWQLQTVSLGAYTGQVVTMRIRLITGSSFGGDAAIDDVLIYDLLAEDAGISAFVNPSLPTCTFNDSVSVNLTNFGTDTLVSTVIDWSWNVTPGTTVNWTGSIAPGGSETVYLGSVPYANGDVLTAWTSLPNGVVEPLSGSSNDTTTITPSTGLNGTYTIGATGDYLTFNDAVTDLTTFGVCGPVVFNVEDGVYNEQITLTEVMGMSAVNTVTFQGLNADPTLATLEYAGTTTVDNFVVWMNGGDFYHFNNLTLSSTGTIFGTVIEMNGGASYNSWMNSIIRGDASVSTTSTNMSLVHSASGGSVDSMNVFDSNTFEYGSYVFYSYGNGVTDLESGTVITNNTMTNFYYRGLHMYYQKDLEIGGNLITPGPNYTGSIYRVYVVYSDDAMKIHNNKMNGMPYGYGVYMSNCDALGTAPGYVYNNFISVGDSASTSTSYGIYVTSCNNQVITNNSVQMSSLGTTTRAMYVTGGSQNRVMNNIFSNDGPGYGMYYVSGITASDNNNIYVPNGVPFYFGSDVNDLATWQAMTTYDMASDTLDPLFVSFDDLHTCEDLAIDGGALPDAMVLLDIDGQVRDSVTPDIGADEFLGLANLAFASDSIWKCTNDALVLGGWEPMDDAISYLWSTTESTPTISVTGTSNYNVIITTACGTANPSTVVENIPDAVAQFTTVQSFLTAATTNTSYGTIDTYFWDFGDGFTTSEMSPTHLYNDTGVYIITLTATGPCGTSVYTDTMYAVLTGLDDASAFGSLNVYPNPTNGNLVIDMGTVQSKTNVAITNVLGQVVLTKSFDATDLIHVDIVGNSGMYFVEITNEEGKSRTVKVLKN